MDFQNTNTCRYREIEVDPDGGEATATGVVRELTSGLILRVSGWVSGDGMVTMEVSATVSNEEGSGAEGAPPRTSERVISTTARTPVGEPLVIGGLRQTSTTTERNKIPLLGDIPLIGGIFQSSRESEETTEFVIYIVPHVHDGLEGAQNLDDKIEQLYRRHILGNN